MQADHFAVKTGDLTLRVPYRHILRLSESSSGRLFKPSVFGGSYPLLIEVFHMVVYRGAVGIGFGVPFDLT